MWRRPMILGELKSIGEDLLPDDDSGRWLVYAAVAGLLVLLAARGAYKHRKESIFYDEDSEPRWPGDER